MPTAIEIADSLEAELRAAFLAMIEVIKHTVPEAQLTDWLERRDFVAIINAFTEAINAAVFTPASSTLTNTYLSIVGRAAGAATTPFNIAGGLTLLSPVVTDRLRRQAGRLLVAVGQDSILAIRETLANSYLEGIGVRAAGRLLREFIGLLPGHANAVGKYAASLAFTPMSDALRANRIETYARRLLAYRAENIARTETMAAAHAGTVEGWLELANRGVIQRNRTRMVWVVTEDDRLCPWCAPMDGMTVELGGLFLSTEKGFPEGKPTATGPGSRRVARTTLRPDPRSVPRDSHGRFVSLAKRDNRDYLDGKLVPLAKPIIVPHPPAHPQCRCDVILRFID